MIDERLNGQILSSNVKPVQVKVNYINGIPYLDYYGEAYTEQGFIVDVHIPRMSLELRQLESVSNIDASLLSYKRELLAVNEDYFTITPRKRTCKIEELEKELGYKLEIID